MLASYAQAYGPQRHESPTLRTVIPLKPVFAFNGSDTLYYTEQPYRYTREKESASFTYDIESDFCVVYCS
jgi:hypothetical protein